MSYILKQLTESSWILQKDGNRICLLLQLPNGNIQAIGDLNKKLFSSIKELESFLGEKLEVEDVVEQSSELGDIDGFPVKHNSILKIDDRDLPIYKKGNIEYAAGYYGVKFNNGWTASFCPKLSTLTENEYIGPFRNKLEMQNSISQKKRMIDI